MNLFLQLSFLLTLFSTENTSPWPYQHIDKVTGISNSAITSVYMDRYDYVWLGSWDGLNRYDGDAIKVYKPDVFQKGTISNNVIRHFLEDKEGNLWVITHQGINRYNRDTDTFQHYLSGTDDLPFMEYNLRAALGPDSVVWTSLLGKGINKYSAERKDFIPVVIEGVGQDWLKNIVDIGSDGELIYLLGGDGKLICAVNNKMVYSRQLSEKGIQLHQFIHNRNTYYFTFSTGDGSLSLLDLSNIEGLPQRIHLSGNPVSSISENKDRSYLWVGTELGDVFKLKNQDGQFVSESMNSYFPQFEKTKRKILNITETRQDILWVGTDGDGVYKFQTRVKPFYSIMAGDTERGGISNSIVRSVLEEEDGTTYVGTRGGGLNIVKPDNRVAKVITTAKGLSNNTVLSMNKDKKGNLWVGVDGEGIDMLEARTGKIFHFPRDFENKTDLAFHYVYAICVDAYGDIWLGTSGKGVIRLKVTSKNGRYHLEEYKQITHSSASANGASSINSNVVYAIVEETPNILWFGTRGAGIYRYNSLADKIEEHFHTGSEKRNQLSNDDVLSLYVSDKEELWIGTSGGVNRLSLRGRPYENKHYTQRDGLPNNTIHGILEDSNHMMWLSTNNGLVMLDPVKNTFKSFDVNDGLENNEYTDGAFFRSAQSEKLFFGGINGLDVIYPTRMDTTSFFPRLTISDFQIHNTVVTPSDSSQILQKHIDATSQISLNYDQNFISFHFTTLDYWNKQRVEYAYFLENFDKDWNFIGQQSVVNLTNIPPGKYLLHINYTNENHVWNSSPRVISIVVSPPFWRTGWAYAFYVIMLIGLQVGVVLVIRQRAKNKRAAAIDKFKIQQMQELNDYKLRFFTNVAHEFRTPLTLIFGPVTSLIKRASSVWEKSQLKTIYNNSLRLQKLIDELIQFRKIESGKEKLEITQVDLVAFTQEIVESFEQYAQELDVHIEFIPTPETLVGWVDTRKLEKILINLISNAIKYNIKAGQVEVQLREKEGRVQIVVKDSGIGIVEEVKEKIFESFFSNPFRPSNDHASIKSAGIGLSLTKSLVQVHKGTIRLESEEGKGTSFSVEIPVRAEDYDVTDSKTIVMPATNLAEKISQEFGYIAQSEEQAEPVSLVADKEYAILVVDDNEQIVVLLQNILADKYRVLTAHNGNEALRTLEEEKVDLVISDVLMPVMDGLSLCRHIKDNIQTSHVPVILLTAKAEIEDRIEGLQVGADSYIPKPFHPEHLFIRIEKLIKNREKIRERFDNFAEVELETISTGIGEKDDAFFVKITQCIQNHLSEPEFTADTIADEVGMSKASLYKKVKAITGLTPHGLIKQYRLKKAADLLRNSNMSVSEVIYETGFNSRSYFYKSFNEMFHCHPKDFGGAKAG